MFLKGADRLLLNWVEMLNDGQDGKGGALGAAKRRIRADGAVEVARLASVERDEGAEGAGSVHGEDLLVAVRAP